LTAHSEEDESNWNLNRLTVFKGNVNIFPVNEARKWFMIHRLVKQ
jgi:hypothetical protein